MQLLLPSPTRISAISQETILRRMLEPLRKQYDHILLDCMGYGPKVIDALRLKCSEASDPGVYSYDDAWHHHTRPVSIGSFPYTGSVHKLYLQQDWHVSRPHIHRFLAHSGTLLNESTQFFRPCMHARWPA